MSVINLGGKGGEFPGADGEDGIGIGGGVGGKGGKGGTAHVVPRHEFAEPPLFYAAEGRCWRAGCSLPRDHFVHQPAEPDVGIALAAIAAEMRRTGQIDGNAELEVEHDGVHFRVVNRDA